MNKGIVVLVGMLAVCACTKVKQNERRMAGNWELTNYHVESYQHNELISEKDSVITGVMQLQNTDGVDNNAYFVGFKPFPTSSCSWEVSADQATVINFYHYEPIYSYLMNIEKVSRSTLILTTYISNDSIDILQKSRMTFKKK